jgi:hypothetical protein
VADLDHFLRTGAAGESQGDGEWNEFSLEQHRYSPVVEIYSARPKGTTNYSRRKAANVRICIFVSISLI